MISQGLHLRAASPADIENLRALIQESVLGLGSADYSPQQLASALTHLFGVDTRLIEDGTYYVVEAEGRPVACGGWSRRRTLFGGDQYSDRSDDRLDPGAEAARIRAFFVHPDWARRGIAHLLLEECERGARASGFRRLELMATLTGLPFERFRQLFVGRGYVPAFPGAAKSFRDSDTGVRIDVISVAWGSGLWICEFFERSLNSAKTLLEAPVLSREPFSCGRELRSRPVLDSESRREFQQLQSRFMASQVGKR